MLVKVSQLKTGMVLAESIYRGAIMVLSQGVQLNRRHIDMLGQMDLDHVSIELKAQVPSFQPNLQEKYKGAVDKFKAICYEASLGQVVIYDQVKACLDPLMKDLEDNPDMALKLWQIEAADAYTYEHSVKVCMLTVLLSKWLGLNLETQKALGKAALLHDIGKCNIPNEILNKPDTLTPEEFSVMKTHATLGYVLLSSTKSLSPEILKGILHHHERYDGAGYPARLKGDHIPYYARIIAVADVFDAMTSNRVYRSKMSPYHVIEIMHGGGGGALDPAITRVFLDHALDFFIGMEVMLSSGESGHVHSNNHHMPYRPRIMVDDQVKDLSQDMSIEIKHVVINQEASS